MCCTFWNLKRALFLVPIVAAYACGDDSGPALSGDVDQEEIGADAETIGGDTDLGDATPDIDGLDVAEDDSSDALSDILDEVETTEADADTLEVGDGEVSEDTEVSGSCSPIRRNSCGPDEICVPAEPENPGTAWLCAASELPPVGDLQDCSVNPCLPGWMCTTQESGPSLCSPGCDPGSVVQECPDDLTFVRSIDRSFSSIENYLELEAGRWVVSVLAGEEEVSGYSLNVLPGDAASVVTVAGNDGRVITFGTLDHYAELPADALGYRAVNGMPDLGAGNSSVSLPAFAMLPRYAPIRTVGLNNWAWGFDVVDGSTLDLLTSFNFNPGGAPESTIESVFHFLGTDTWFGGGKFPPTNISTEMDAVIRFFVGANTTDRFDIYIDCPDGLFANCEGPPIAADLGRGDFGPDGDNFVSIFPRRHRLFLVRAGATPASHTESQILVNNVDLDVIRDHQHHIVVTATPTGYQFETVYFATPREERSSLTLNFLNASAGPLWVLSEYRALLAAPGRFGFAAADGAWVPVTPAEPLIYRVRDSLHNETVSTGVLAAADGRNSVIFYEGPREEGSTAVIPQWIVVPDATSAPETGGSVRFINLAWSQAQLSYRLFSAEALQCAPSSFDGIGSCQ